MLLKKYSDFGGGKKYNVIQIFCHKAGQNILAPRLLKLFNSILSSGFYSDHWSTGYLSPIFKSGDRSKPENYRGITITGCLGKLLNSILNNRLDDFLT
jgi:hypothetical protein